MTRFISKLCVELVEYLTREEGFRQEGDGNQAALSAQYKDYKSTDDDDRPFMMITTERYLLCPEECVQSELQFRIHFETPGNCAIIPSITPPLSGGTRTTQETCLHK